MWRKWPTNIMVVLICLVVFGPIRGCSVALVQILRLRACTTFRKNPEACHKMSHLFCSNSSQLLVFLLFQTSVFSSSFNSFNTHRSASDKCFRFIPCLNMPCGCVPHERTLSITSSRNGTDETPSSIRKMLLSLRSSSAAYFSASASISLAIALTNRGLQSFCSPSTLPLAIVSSWESTTAQVASALCSPCSSFATRTWTTCKHASSLLSKFASSPCFCINRLSSSAITVFSSAQSWDLWESAGMLLFSTSPARTASGSTLPSSFNASFSIAGVVIDSTPTSSLSHTTTSKSSLLLVLAGAPLRVLIALFFASSGSASACNPSTALQLDDNREKQSCQWGRRFAHREDATTLDMVGRRWSKELVPVVVHLIFNKAGFPEIPS